MAVAESTVKIVVTAVDQATATVQKVASGVKGSIDNMRSSIKSWIDDTALASVAFTALFTKVAKGAINTAADFEKAGIMTRFLTDNTEAANKYSQALIDLALTTPFTTKEITTLGSRMIGQVKDVDTSVLGMKALTNAVSATGGGIMELENAQRALTQTFIKAKPSLEELNKQFNNANIPVMRALSKHLADGTVKLKGYTDAVVVTGGASKKLAGDATKAKEVIEDSAWKTDKLTASMNRVKDKFGESSYQFKEAKDKLGDWSDKVGGAQGTIEKYNSAISNTSRTVIGFHKTQEQIMSDLQDVSELGVTGKDTAVAIMQALALEYAGANETMLNSFSGLTRNIVDQIQVVSSSIMGIDKNLNVREGSIFYYLKLGAKGLSDFLAAHRYDIADFVDSLLKNKVALISIATIIISMLIPAFITLNKWMGITKLLLGGLALTPWTLTLAFAITFLIDRFGGLNKVLKDVGTAFGIIIDVSKGFDPGAMMDDATWNRWKSFADIVERIIGPFRIALQIIKDVSKGFDPGAMMDDATWRKWGGFATIVANIGQAFRDVGTAFGIIIDVARGWDPGAMMDDATWNRWKGFVGLIEIIGQKIQILPTLFQPFIILLSASMAQIQPLFAQWIVLIQQIIPGLQILGQALLGIVAILLTLAGAILTGFLTMLPTLLTGIVQNFTGIVQFVMGFFQILIGIFTLNGELIKQGWDNLWKSVHNLFLGFINAVIGSVVGFIAGVIAFFETLAKTLTDETIPNMSKGLVKGFENMKKKVIAVVENIANGIKSTFEGLVSAAWNWGYNIIKNIINGIKTAIKAAGKLAGKLLGELGISSEELAKLQHGGIVPGPVGQPMPAIVHGGERITPRGGVDESARSMVGGGITININGSVTMDSEDRVRELARLIMRMLSRESELSRYGVGY